MSHIRITNCHIHLFHAGHVPDNYPYWFVKPFKRAPFLLGWIAALLRLIVQHPAADKLERLRLFQKEAQGGSQRSVLDSVRRHYPADTRFVVLP
ncbi:MAG: hypothetical protein AAF408_19445, partial [Pseudomonadota bacterium]